MRTLHEMAAALASGETTSRDLTDACLAKIEDPDGEGPRAFISVDAKGARAQADAMDALRAAGVEPSPFAGIPISLKDLFDVRGQVTAAGSRVLADAAPSEADAPCIAHLRQAGFVFLGRNNMSEFAYSGIGINPHYGTPRNPFDRETGRVPGGSSSGAAVSVADGMAVAAIGTDTGGSCRIPAGFCGITGYKPTAARVSLAGATPLSSSLDSIGPLANSVACCAILDGILTGDNDPVPEPRNLSQLHLGVLASFVNDDLDDHVGSQFEAALSALSKAGVKITTFEFADLYELPNLNTKGGIAAAEAYAWHQDLIEARGDEYDPRVAARIKAGKGQTAADYIALLNARETMIARADAVMAPFDAVVMPTVPTIAPAIDSLADDSDFARNNMLALRNTAVGNFLDRCAISIPIDTGGSAPVGFMMMGETWGDDVLFAAALAVEACLQK
jgi:aspartyl-tRNA(Asn)/glutamyl-tRNA(Gln) amidotransferase subunit A